MICALFDYLCYRNGLGIYSAESIAVRGGKLATSENFPSPSQFEPMDIFFMHTRNSALSWCVMYFSGPGPWSHTGVFVGNGMIVDATLSGVVEHPFRDYLDGISYICVIRPPGGGPQKKREAVQWLKDQVGCEYNWAGVWRLLVLHLSGRVARYRVGFAIDAAIFFSLLLLLLHRWPIGRNAVLVLAGLYYAIVVVSVLGRHLGGFIRRRPT